MGLRLLQKNTKEEKNRIPLMKPTDTYKRKLPIWLASNSFFNHSLTKGQTALTDYRHGKKETKKDQQEKKQYSGWHMKGNRTRNIILMIVILVFVGSWLIPGIFGITIGIIGGVFGSCVGMLFGGLALTGAGIYKMFTTVPYGLLMLGGGFLMIAGGILLLWLLVWICAKAIPWIITKIREIWSRNFGRGCE